MNRAILVRILRNAAGLALGALAAYLPEALGLINVPDAVQPFIPFVVGPLVNALAKGGRMMLEDGVAAKVCRVF